MRTSQTLTTTLSVLLLAACGTHAQATDAPTTPAPRTTVQGHTDLVSEYATDWSLLAVRGKAVDIVVTSGGTGCHGQRVTVVETPEAVTVGAFTGRLPAHQDGFCTAEEAHVEYRLQLASPLGDRKLVDARAPETRQTVGPPLLLTPPAATHDLGEQDLRLEAPTAWTATGHDHTLEVSVTTGSAGCAGERLRVQEVADVVVVQAWSGTRPDKVGTPCPTATRQAVHQVTLGRPVDQVQVADMNGPAQDVPTTPGA